ncbi:uncharacterized protein GLRG_08929 [Colletotrichum graminicola M1.001]|uniref:Uncharacterized protein n=1 Tax=Colletotrichum graminicola (strain M1.001 / M2 / FGSC 10212) TaxID=645133 RepID=E3QSF8_COLGM|nr:uncharacterized protein GLRG_08929 [Colletotrichum graminicola M1.001]EFQ33785.1 hypothetical protein GLRG_08929 [Colletotrichum graminicola M1.001]
MQTDGIIGPMDLSFSDWENEELAKAKFAAKDKSFLAVDQPLTFNGGIITVTSTTDTSVTLRQKGQGTKLQLIDASSPTAHQDFVQQQARGAYIASSHGARCSHKGAGNMSDDSGDDDDDSDGDGLAPSNYKKPSVAKGHNRRTPGGRLGKNVGQSDFFLGTSAKPLILDQE